MDLLKLWNVTKKTPINARLALLTMFTLTATIHFSYATVSLPPIFSDHAVLLRSPDTPVFGTAEPGEQITVTLANVSAISVADDDGRWLVRLNLADVGHGPFELTVAGTTANLTRYNILVGQVWLANGQSNMEYRVREGANARQVTAQSTDPLLRVFSVRFPPRDRPDTGYLGDWREASPKDTGEFSAVSYFFARELRQELIEPVGVVVATLGASPIEAWIDRETLRQYPRQKEVIDQLEATWNNYDLQLETFMTAHAAWREKFARRPEDLVTAETLDWHPQLIPGHLPGDGGIVLVRRRIELPVTHQGNLHLNLGRLNTPCQVFWNGELLAELSFAKVLAQNSHLLTIPAKLVLAENELCLRFTSAESIVTTGNFYFRGGLSLNGSWESAWVAQLPLLDSDAKNECPKRPGVRPSAERLPGALYELRIRPLIPYGFAGIIFYQGESNSSRPDRYAEAFQLLIASRRRDFGRDLPFYWCQLANYQAKSDNPAQIGDWPLLRAAQTEALQLPNTGQAILIDQGEAKDIHPFDKETAAKRLAALALARHYGKSRVDSGPVLRTVQVEGAAIRLFFDQQEDGLVAHLLPEMYPMRLREGKTAPLLRYSPDSELEGFAVCDANNHWFWANANIDGDSVVVTAEAVPKPVQIRYAWQDNPNVNLYNQAGFPAAPFQITLKKWTSE